MTFIDLHFSLRKSMLVCKRLRTRKGKRIVNDIINKLPIELHIPGYQYCGPNTKLARRLARGDPGLNQLDKASRHTADKILEDKALHRASAKDASVGEKAAAWSVSNLMKMEKASFHCLLATADTSVSPVEVTPPVVPMPLHTSLVVLVIMETERATSKIPQSLDRDASEPAVALSDACARVSLPCTVNEAGFIVVAACVMTFEARDSAAKVVPARFRFNQSSTLKYARCQRPRRSTSSQTTKWDHQLGLFRINKTPSPNAHDISRKALTAEFVKFSRNLGEKGVPEHPIKKSPSAPSLVMKKSPSRRKTSKFAGCALLNPELLQRHAVSVDNPGYSPPRVSGESLDKKTNGSQVSMAMDLYIPNKGPITLKIKDRSDTARRHQLHRQGKIDDIEDEEAKKVTSRRKPYSDSIGCPTGASSRYATDFVPQKRASIDLRLMDDFGAVAIASHGSSPRDFRNTSSSNIRNMSVDRSSSRKTSLEFRKSPDFRRADYRYFDDIEVRSRTNISDSRRHRQKLNHSKSDDNRRRSFDRHRKDFQETSRHSLTTPVLVEGCGPEYELKYFTSLSFETEDRISRIADVNHVVEIKETKIQDYDSPEEPIDGDALLEEPELENINDTKMFPKNENEKRPTRSNEKDKEKDNNFSDVLMNVDK
ncbi:uncharacterized protein [Fopius arisanus]|uniref:Uncharacterized protein n=1 Tax=Fopius arisanus TaxID=64838 RepID=A0A9R1U978_9HYME|nr:PREDICTED: uncharacterized protein LOC105272543 [Fopius arisanus]